MFVKSPMSSGNVKENVRRPKKQERLKKARRVSLPFSGRKSADSASHGKKASSSAPVIPFNELNPAKVVLWAFILGVCGFAYITHVFTMQQMLNELTQTQREFDRVRIIHENQALIYNRMTGPADVYSRARQQGLIDSDPADHIIIINR